MPCCFDDSGVQIADEHHFSPMFRQKLSLWVCNFYRVNTDGTISIQVTSEKPAIHLFTLCVTPGAQDVEQNTKKTGWYNLHNFYLQLQHALRISKESARNEVKPPWI